MREYGHIFVTVGTTQFDALIAVISTAATAAAIRRLGCKRLTIQTGSGYVNERTLLDHYGGIDVKLFTFHTSIAEQMAQADLVVCHAGAGTCLQALHAGKPIVVVVNESLMGNHQLELAERLSDGGYLFHCLPDRLNETLERVATSGLLPYQRGDARRLTREIDLMME